MFSALEHILRRMQTACERAQRAPETVQLVMVSKTVPVERLADMLNNPYQQCIFGENKAQELQAKASYFQVHKRNPSPEWHFIGHLQSNKIKDMLPYTQLLHSLDRWSLAQKLDRKLQAENKTLSVLIQVNAAREDSKSGVAPEQTLELVRRVNELESLSIQGLMTIGAHSNNENEVRDSFKRLADLREQASSLPDLAPQNQELPHLSMGMSGDFEWAIEEGATLVRVGSAIFGSRQ